jgi:threonine-phosphate decarboxylase
VKRIRGITFSQQKFLASMEEGQLAYLCNPNNPTGELISPEAVAGIAAAALRKKCYLVLDEAFVDFVGAEKSACPQTAGNPYLIVLRSLTKFHALAALRIGYAVMHPAAARRISAFKEPWSVNSFSMEAAGASLRDAAYKNRTLRLIGSEKKYIEGRLGEMGAEFFPSAANFYLVRMNGAKKFISQMAEKGFLLRDCSNFGGLAAAGDRGYIRFAVRKRRENRLLLDQMEKWIGANQ